MTNTIGQREKLVRPIIGIENRTPQEVFDIMIDRIKLAALSSPPAGEDDIPVIEPLFWAWLKERDLCPDGDPVDWADIITALDEHEIEISAPHPNTAGEVKTGGREAIARIIDPVAFHTFTTGFPVVPAWRQESALAKAAAILALSPTSGGGTGEPDWDEFRTVLETWMTDLHDTLGARHQEGGGGASDEERSLLCALNQVLSAAPSSPEDIGGLE